MSAGAVIAIRRRRLVKQFRDAGATNAAHATTLEALGERRSWIFDQMVREGVFSNVNEGRYFMNEEAAVEFLHQHRVRTFAIGGVLLLLFILFCLLGWFGL